MESHEQWHVISADVVSFKDSDLRDSALNIAIPRTCHKTYLKNTETVRNEAEWVHLRDLPGIAT